MSADKKRRFEAMRKQHYNMKQALQQVSSHTGVCTMQQTALALLQLLIFGAACCAW
jgi:hypothetical protein